MIANEKKRARFWSRIDKSGDCWIWKGARNRYGYGVLQLNGAFHVAHRVSFALFNGPIERGKILLHSCDNAACVNPEHLSQGTHSQNLRDAHERGRRSHRHRQLDELYEYELREIRGHILAGIKHLEIAKGYGISRHTFDRVRGKADRRKR